MLSDPHFWALVAFLLFFALLAWLGVHRTLITALDDRSTRIKAELDEARRLRDEAQSVLAEYQRKRGEAEREAESIITAARDEAERLAADAKEKVEDFVARRTKMAETKIVQAEAQAVADVRAAAAEAAVAAAEKILAETARGKVGDDLI